MRRSRLGRSYDREKAARRAAFSRAVLTRSWCEIEDLHHDCTGRATEAHHVLPRSRGGTDDPVENGLACCRNGHQAIHAYPHAARIVGYLR